ncbi:unnamed protein product [Hanseniaspora opuntiae]
MSKESFSGGNQSPSLAYNIRSKEGNNVKLSPSIDYEHINSINPRNYNANTTEKTFETILSEDEEQVENDNERFTPIDRPNRSKFANSDYLDSLGMLPNSALSNGLTKI